MSLPSCPRSWLLFYEVNLLCFYWDFLKDRNMLLERLVGKDGAVDHISPSSLFDPSRKNFGRRFPGSAMNVNQILCLLSGGQTKGAGSGTGSGLGAITLFEPRRRRLYCDGMVLVFNT